METINKRIALVRKSKEMTQKDFGAKINIKKSTMCDLEKDGRTITDKNAALICSQYGVNKEWLLTGAGEMFLSDDCSALENYAKKYNLTDREKKLFEKLMELDDDMQKCFFDHIESAFAIKQCAEKSEKELKLVGFGGTKTVKTSANEIKKAAEKDSCNNQNNDTSLF